MGVGREQAARSSCGRAAAAPQVQVLRVFLTTRFVGDVLCARRLPPYRTTHTFLMCGPISGAMSGSLERAYLYACARRLMHPDLYDRVNILSMVLRISYQIYFLSDICLSLSSVDWSTRYYYSYRGPPGPVLIFRTVDQVYADSTVTGTLTAI